VLAVGGTLVGSFIVGLCLYFLPTIIAVARKVRNQGSVVAINLFLCWTLIGWVIALANAFRRTP
jgi:4-amino-4-deoxy-L-arabinose transferase-like glycosyltransferase